MQADGSNRRILGDYGRARWSPDGSQFMVVAFTKPRQVTLMDVVPEKSGPLQLHGQNVFAEPSWAGGGLIVAAIGTDTPDAIALIDVSEPSQARIKEILWKKGKGLDVTPYHPVNSAAKGRCIFVGHGEKGMALYQVPHGQHGQARRLEPAGFDPKINDPTMSPDGRYVVFASNRPAPPPGKPAPAGGAAPRPAAKGELVLP